jgi:hypothetical protein
MNGTTFRLNWLALVASALGAAIFALGLLGYDEINEPSTSVDNTLQVPNEEAPDPTLDQAVHAAAVRAVAIENGRFEGETFKIARIEVTAGNPHIKAYRVILERDD